MIDLVHKHPDSLQLNLVVLPEDGVLRAEAFTDEAALLARLQQILESGEEVALAPSFGFKLGISRPPLRYLVTPWGNLPLYQPLPISLELEEDGFVGQRYAVPLPVDAAEIARIESAAEEDEELDAPTADEEPELFGEVADELDG